MVAVVVWAWLEALTKALQKIGARLKVVNRRGSRNPLRFNVGTDRQGEFFTLSVNEESEAADVRIVGVDQNLAQALILVVTKDEKGKEQKEKLLLGHDERHWFVAGVPEKARNIKDAFKLLKPEAARLSQERTGVGGKALDKRKNKGFIRQGEWFFVPVQFEPDKKTHIYKNEPIQRAPGSSPHTVEKLVRMGGQQVYILGSKIYTQEQKDAHIAANGGGHFQARTQNATVFATGKVSHKDHKAVYLQGWHEVHLSREPGNTGRGAQGFLD
jgi:hypothetical protein